MHVIISDECEIWSTPIESTFIFHFKKAGNLLYQITINYFCSLRFDDLNNFLLMAGILFIVYCSYVIMYDHAISDRRTKFSLIKMQYTRKLLRT